MTKINILLFSPYTLCEQQAEWERQAHYHHEQEPEAWEDGEYEQMMFEVEGY